MKRIKSSNLLSAIVALLLIVGAIAAIGSITGNTKESVSGFAFSIGGLDDAGEYVERKDAIYTKDLIGCVGLEVTPDFESAVKYRVFYYDENETFISATDLSDEAHVNKLAQPKYCRIMIVPDSGEEINFWEFWKIYDFADDISIKVDKEQIEPKDYFAEAVKNGTYNVTIDCSDISKLIIEGFAYHFENGDVYAVSNIEITILDSSGNAIDNWTYYDHTEAFILADVSECAAVEILYGDSCYEQYGAISIEVYEYR